MRYKIIASDLDGTLLNTNGQISKENEQAIQRFTEQGGYFVPSSGRTLYEMPSIVRDNPYIRYIIHSDGAVVYDKQTGKKLDMSMSRESVGRLLDILFEYDICLTVRNQGRSYTAQEWFCDEVAKYHRMSDTWRDFMYEYITPVPDFEKFCYSLESAEMICVFFHCHEELMACRERLSQEGVYGIAASEPENLEIFDRSAGKGEALRRLADHLEIDPSQTIAVGDSPNDRNMLERAGLGLAMANACEELKAVADATVCHCNEHVARYILENYVE